MIDFSKLKQMRDADKDRFYLIVAGSRIFDKDGSMFIKVNGEDVLIDNVTLAFSLIDKVLRSRVNEGKEIIIVHGNADGVDTIGKLYAEERGYKQKVFEPDWAGLGNYAGMARNKQMYTFVSLKPNKGAVLIWDGDSSGTYNNFLQAREYDVPLRCYNFMDKRWLSKHEVEQIQYCSFNK